MGRRASVDALKRSISLPALGSEPQFFLSCLSGSQSLWAIGSLDHSLHYMICADWVLLGFNMPDSTHSKPSFPLRRGCYGM